MRAHADDDGGAWEGASAQGGDDDSITPEAEETEEDEGEWRPYASASGVLARFVNLYPGALVNSAYPTRDHVVPADWFDVLVQEMDGIDARHELSTAKGTAHGQAMLTGTPKANRLTQRLHRIAYPQVWRHEGASDGTR